MPKYPDKCGYIVCSECERELPGDSKHFHKRDDGFRYRCKECRGGSFGLNDINKVKDAQDGYKYCSSCHKELPASDDYFFNGGKDKNGLTSQCKKCQSGSEYGTTRPNYRRDDSKWRCTSCQTLYERTEENFYTTGDGLMVYCKECHTQRVNQMRREYENDVENTLTQPEWESICERWNGECAYCATTPDTLEKDHIVPISKEGGTKKTNIVPACPDCNRSKGDKSITEWYGNQPFYDKTREAKVIHITYDEI